jgi:hypothetical protein
MCDEWSLSAGFWGLNLNLHCCGLMLGERAWTV